MFFEGKSSQKHLGNIYKFFEKKEQFRKSKNAAPRYEKAVNGTGGKPGTGKKSVETVTKEVLAGKWGNGEDRKKRLQAAGYDYGAVQRKVNELMRQQKACCCLWRGLRMMAGLFLLGNKYYVQVRNLWLVIATIFIKMYTGYINLDV